MRQRSASYTSERRGMQRSQSEIEIQKYAEDDKDKDFSDIFGHDVPSLPKADSDSGSEQNSLAMITSKMSSSFVCKVPKLCNVNSHLTVLDRYGRGRIRPFRQFRGRIREH